MLFLINGTVMEDHFREQVASTPWELFVRLSYPVQTLVRTLNRRRGAVMRYRLLRQPWGLQLGDSPDRLIGLRPGDTSQLVGCRRDDHVDRRP